MFANLPVVRNLRESAYRRKFINNVDEHLFMGSYDSFEAAQAAVQLDRRLGLVDHLAVPLIVLGQIHQCHGDLGRAFTAYQEALQLAEQVAEPQLLFPCYDGLATLYLDAGRPDEAEAWLAKAQALCESAGLEPDALMVLPFLC